MHSYKWCKIYIHILSHYKLGRIKFFLEKGDMIFNFACSFCLVKFHEKLIFVYLPGFSAPKKMYSWMDRCVDVNLKYFTYFFTLLEFPMKIYISFMICVTKRIEYVSSIHHHSAIFCRKMNVFAQILLCCQIKVTKHIVNTSSFSSWIMNFVWLFYLLLHKLLCCRN